MTQDNKPLSKEEILNLENSRPDEMQTDWIVVTRKAAIAAMDEYAKQCLGIATTLLRRAYELNHDDMGFDIDVSEFFDKIGETI